MKYNFIIHDDEGGLWAECVEIHGIVTQGNDKHDLMEKIQQTANLYFEDVLEDDSSVYPLPLEENHEQYAKVEIDPRISQKILSNHLNASTKTLIRINSLMTEELGRIK